ncbi:odorant receptor 30a-like [Fopius arisanus]|uniref:Odorant receptor n=1 Tax=Fopius arisanus TaxID=64838 RepID=A0A9R1UAL6_9HYME|nr:PREDICTED: odorant receptor 30a-like [Fopius arisanus]
MILFCLTISFTMARLKEQTYDEAVSLIRSYLSIFGLWIYPNSSLFRKRCSHIPICFINCCLCICVIIPEMWALYRIRKDMELVIGNLMVSLTFYLSIIKTFFLLFKREALRIFFKKIEEDWKARMTRKEQNMLVKRWKLIKLISISAFVIAVTLSLAHNSTVYFNFVVRVLTNLTDTIPGRPLVFSSVYPFDTQPSPRYEVLVFIEQLEGIVACITAIIPDVLYAAFVFHACGQLEILSSRIEKIGENTSENFNQFLKSSVTHHLRIIKFVENIDNLFNGFILGLILYFTLVFCSQAFMAMTVTGRSGNKDEMMLKLYRLCSPAGIDMESADLLNAAYNCNWIDLPPNKAISLCMICLRSQKPLGITAGKFLPVTLNTYAKGGNYLGFLRDRLITVVVDGPADNAVWFQHDGAPAHTSVAVVDQLDEWFPDRWIGNRSDRDRGGRR